MRKTDEQLLEEAGYELICESPFEIEMVSYESEPLGTATGRCAEEILRKLRKKDDKRHRNKMEQGIDEDMVIKVPPVYEKFG